MTLFEDLTMRWFIFFCLGNFAACGPTLLCGAEPKPSIVLEGPFGLPDTIIFSSDGKTLFSKAPDKGLTMEFDMVLSAWELPTGKAIKHLPLNAVSSTMAIAADGSSIATSEAQPARLANAPVLRVRDARTGRLTFSYAAGSAYALSPDGSRLAIGLEERQPQNAITKCGVLRIVEIPSGKNRLLWEGTTFNGKAFQRPPAVTSVAFSPTGKRLAAAWGDNLVRIFDLSNGQVLSDNRPPSNDKVLSRDHLRWQDEDTVVAGVDFRRINAKTGESSPLLDSRKLSQGPTRAPNVLFGNRLEVANGFMPGWSPTRVVNGGVRGEATPHANGNATERVQLTVRDIASSELIHYLTLDLPAGHSRHSSLAAYAVSRDGKWLALATKPGQIALFEIDALPRENESAAGAGKPELTSAQKSALTQMLPVRKTYIGVGQDGGIRGQKFSFHAHKRSREKLDGMLRIGLQSTLVRGKVGLDGSISWGTIDARENLKHNAQGTIKDGVIQIEFFRPTNGGKPVSLGTARLKIEND